MFKYFVMMFFLSSCLGGNQSTSTGSLTNTQTQNFQVSEKICTPNSIESLECLNSISFANTTTQTKTCSIDGTYYNLSLCQVLTCKEGYTLSKNSCVPQNCMPNSKETYTCTGSIENASEASLTMTCNNDGLSASLSPCTLKSCQSGYLKAENSCVPVLCDGQPVGSTQKRTRYQFEALDNSLTCDNYKEEQKRTCLVSGNWSEWSGNYIQENCRNYFAGIKGLQEIDLETIAMGLSNSHIISVGSQSVRTINTSTLATEESKNFTELGIQIPDDNRWKSFTLNQRIFLATSKVTISTSSIFTNLFELKSNPDGKLNVSNIPLPGSNVYFLGSEPESGMALFWNENQDIGKSEYFSFDGANFRSLGTNEAIAFTSGLDPSLPTKFFLGKGTWYRGSYYSWGTTSSFNSWISATKNTPDDYARLELRPIHLFKLSPTSAPASLGVWLSGYNSFDYFLNQPIQPLMEDGKLVVYHRQRSDSVNPVTKYVESNILTGREGGFRLEEDNLSNVYINLNAYVLKNKNIEKFPFYSELFKRLPSGDEEIRIQSIECLLFESKCLSNLGKVLLSRSNCMSYYDHPFNSGCSGDTLQTTFFSYNNKNYVSLLGSRLAKISNDISYAFPLPTTSSKGEPLKKHSFIPVNSKLFFVGGTNKIYVFEDTL